MAGKGDKPRPVDKKIYNKNYEQISWSKSSTEQPKLSAKIKNKTRFVY